jgi:hypothetical protein
MFRKDNQREKIDQLSPFVIQGKSSLAENELLSIMAINPNSNIVLNKTALAENNRQWQSVSPLEYAVWAGNITMIETLLKHIPEEHESDVIEQLNKIQAQGTEHGKPLAAIKNYVEAYVRYNRSLDSEDFENKKNSFLAPLLTQQQQLPANWQKQHCPRDNEGLNALQEALNRTISDFKDIVANKHISQRKFFC